MAKQYYIGKVANPHFIIKPNREFYDTECPLTGDQVELAAEISRVSNELNDYLGEVYARLRQGADPSTLEVPECLTVEKAAPSPAKPAKKRGKRASAASSSDSSQNS